MRFTGLRPTLYTNELEATVTFYTRTLGFTCESLDFSAGWASLRRDDVGIMLSLPNKHLPYEKPIFTGSIYITIDTVDVLWNQVKEKAAVCYEIETFSYGMREFAIFDNNGYLIQFGQQVG